MGSLVFEQYADRLQRRVAKGEASANSVRGFLDAARRLDRWLETEGLTAESATFTTLEEYFDTLPLATSSRGTHLRQIKAAYNYAIRRGTLRHNPALDLTIPEEESGEPKIISGGCLREIKERIVYERDWIFFFLLAYTGMRRSEIRGLVWDDGRDLGSVVRLEQQTIRVFGKGRKTRLVPIHPALGEVLTEHRREPGAFVVPSNGRNGVAIDTIQEMSKRLSAKYTPHDYRRTVSTSLRRNGVDMGVIDRIMGWAPRTVFRRYYDNVADGELHRAILKLYADDPI